MKSNNDDIYKIYENDITLFISKNEYVTEEIVFYAHKLVDKVERSKSYKSVSYTHLTLPTKAEV